VCLWKCIAETVACTVYVHGDGGADRDDDDNNIDDEEDNIDSDSNSTNE
jgi:hypothetical protein